MPYLHMAMAQQTPDVEQACLFPRFEQLALFADQNPEHSLASALRAFADRCVQLHDALHNTNCAHRNMSGPAVTQRALAGRR